MVRRKLLMANPPPPRAQGGPKPSPLRFWPLVRVPMARPADYGYYGFAGNVARALITERAQILMTRRGTR